ncbi:MAG TPA: hypothetical protein PK514_08890 [Spirochaetota bacterium]|nr:hypothetical protein [Spirochaetota bacterium]
MNPSVRIPSSFFILLFILTLSCGSKGPAAGSPEEVLMLLKKHGGTDDIRGLYSAATIKNMEQYMDASGMDEQAAINTLSFIAEDAEYSVQNVSVKGDSCSMNLKFLKAGPEKSRGLLVTLTMVKENGNWRLDRSADFKKLLQAQKNRETENYLNRIR